MIGSPSIFMFISNVTFVCPAILFGMKRHYLYTFIFFGVFVASTIYHICFEIHDLPQPWILYNMFKCYKFNVSTIYVILSSDYIFSNVAAFSIILLLFPIHKIMVSDGDHDDKSKKLVLYNDHDNVIKAVSVKKNDFTDTTFIDTHERNYDPVYTSYVTIFTIIIASVCTFIYFKSINGLNYEDIEGGLLLPTQNMLPVNIITFICLLVLLTILILKNMIIIYSVSKSINVSIRILLYFWINALMYRFSSRIDHNTYKFKIVCLAIFTGISSLISWSVIQRLFGYGIHPVWHFGCATTALLIAYAIIKNYNSDESIST
jgi:hypothetical protein